MGEDHFLNTNSITT